MSKVLVDRELLEQTVKHLEWDGDGSQTVMQYAQQGDRLAEELAEAIAQPAEAEGVELRALPAREWAERAPSRNVVLEDEAIAALSAVTAERDRLQEQCELNDMVHGTKGRERVAALLAQNEELRKDAAAGAVVWKFIDRMGDPAESILAEFVAAFDAAMAAKEA